MLYLRATLDTDKPPAEAAHMLRLCASKILTYAQKLEQNPAAGFRARVNTPGGSVLVVHITPDEKG